MPQVPDVEQRVLGAPLPGARFTAAPTADMLGAGIGDTLQHTGAQLFARYHREANETALFDADTALADTQTQLETKLQGYQGAQVLGASKELGDDWKKATDAISNKLPNDQVRGAFATRAQQRWAQLNRTVQRWTAQKWTEHQDKSSISTINSVADRVRQLADGTPESESAIMLERIRGGEAIRAFGERKGLTGPVTKQMRDDPEFAAQYTSQGLEVPAEGARFASPQYMAMQKAFASQVHREVINGLLAKDMDLEAKRYFTANRGELTAEDLDRTERVVLEGSLRGNSQRKVQEIMGITGGMKTAEQRREQFALAKKIEDPKLQDAVTDRLKHEHSTYDQLESQNYTDTFMRASQTIDERWGDSAFLRKEARDMVSPATWNTLKPDDQRALELKLDRLRKPDERTHDEQRWLDFSGIPKEKLAAMPAQKLLKDYLLAFDAKHYDQAINEWQAARNLRDKGDKEDKYVQAITHREMIHNTWVESKLAKDPSKLTDEEKVLFARWESRATRALNALPKGSSVQGAQTILDKLKDELLLTKLRAPGAFWGWMDKEIRAIQIPDVEDQSAIRIPYDQISPADIERYKGGLMKAGKTVTKEKIEQMAYRERLLLQQRNEAPNGR